MCSNLIPFKNCTICALEPHHRPSELLFPPYSSRKHPIFHLIPCFEIFLEKPTVHPGFTKDTHQYFMKASPVRPGDYLEFFAEIPLLGALSACPGGDTSTGHSDDTAKCYPLLVEVFEASEGVLDGWKGPEVCGYAGKHGLK